MRTRRIRAEVPSKQKEGIRIKIDVDGRGRRGSDNEPKVHEIRAKGETRLEGMWRPRTRPVSVVEFR